MRHGTYLKPHGSAGLIVDLLVAHGNVPSAAADLAGRCNIPLAQATSDVCSVVEAIGGRRRSTARPLRRPTFRGTRTVLHEWKSLSWAVKWAVANTAVVLAVVEVGLRIADVRSLAGLLRTPLADARAPLVTASEGDMAGLSDRERTKLLAIKWVLARWLVPDTCLRRALLTGCCLRRRHPSLHLGVVADGRTAHAWIEAQGVAYDMGEVVGAFGVLS